MKLFSFLLFGSLLILHSQPVSIGVKGGLLLTDALRYSYDESPNYTVGPTVEFRLPRNFGIETGFLYKRVGSSASYSFGPAQAHIRTRGNSFEIPVVGKYYFTPSKLFTPYLGLGVAMRRTWYTTEASNNVPPVPPFNSVSKDVSPFGAGAAGAAGVQFRYGRLKFSPEVRYTRWSAETQRLSRNPNQAEFLLGISF